MNFTIPIPPHGQMRPRYTSRGKFHKAYKADGQVTMERQLMAYLKDHAPEKPFEGPVLLDVVALFARPKHHYGTGRNSGKLKKTAPVWHTKKPDADNLLKMLKDCMNEIFYKDDKQVCVTRIRKQYSERPRWEINIDEMP